MSPAGPSRTTNNRHSRAVALSSPGPLGEWHLLWPDNQLLAWSCRCDVLNSLPISAPGLASPPRVAPRRAEPTSRRADEPSAAARSPRRRRAYSCCCCAGSCRASACSSLMPRDAQPHDITITIEVGLRGGARHDVGNGKQHRLPSTNIARSPCKPCHTFGARCNSNLTSDCGVSQRYAGPGVRDEVSEGVAGEATRVDAALWHVAGPTPHVARSQKPHASETISCASRVDTVGYG